MRLLLAEDEKELANALAAVLKHNNYSIDVVYNGADAYDWAQAAEYDGIILDIMMPKMSGLEVLEALRKQGCTVPILLLTAKGEIEDRVTGLDMGADDYLPKPFAMKELLARIRAMTRRKSEFSANVLDFEGLTLNRENFELAYKSQSLRLGNKEFQMMEMLMRNSNQFLSAEQFMEKIWGFDAETEVSVVWVYLSYLRKKLQNLEAPVEIKAARGIGYKLEKKA
ncbi:response regulator transcription factor [Blautia producta]|uniref:Stage 0 sporulation protein A homolog n=1 Tax=Blautia producta TaxID=33035 RepID=A0A4P6LXV0_9FIRM|nr:response regulator transcription factor [Blautia producta]QBE97474.1 Response regulator ArlR [Blautia producta]